MREKFLQMEVIALDEVTYDVAVVGGGPAGFAAALSSARNGAKTILVERYGFVGGVAASGLPFLNFFNRNRKQVIKGVAEELVQRLKKENATTGHIFPKRGHIDSIAFVEPEWVKIVAEEMLIEAGCDILYHTFAFDVKREANKISSVVVANKGGKHEIKAHCFVDATGDGDIAAFGGAEYQKGRMPDGLMQAMSLIFRLGRVDVEKVGELWREAPVFATPFGTEREYNIHPTAMLNGWEDILKKMKLFEDEGHWVWSGTLQDGELTYVNTIRVSGLDPTDPVEFTKAEIEARKQLKKVLKFFNQYIPGMDKSYLTSVAPQIGIRETRRIIGEYILTAEDILVGRKFWDSIAKCGYCIDIHDPKGKGWKANFIESEDATYDIPYRCLVPNKIDGLLVAGRCISTTHEALGSTRIMPCCMALGEAAGVAAALSASTGISPRNIDVEKIQQKLVENGAII